MGPYAEVFFDLIFPIFTKFLRDADLMSHGLTFP
jgi:hypothetical protein